LIKVRLIEPSWYKPGGRLKKLKKLLIPSPTLPLLAALVPADIEVGITNELFEQVDFNENVDIVGITCYSAKAIRAYEIADEFRRRGKYVVMGGIHVSMEPQEALAHADTVVIGEAEKTWPDFIRDFKNGSPQKTYCASNLAPLEKLPLPKFSLLNRKNYVFFAGNDSRLKLMPLAALPVQTSRGCPHACDFCSVTLFAGKRYRMRPVKEVVEEIQALKLKTIFFSDDNIFAVPSRARELFEALIPLNIHWTAQATLSIADDRELVRLAAKSGCLMIMAGLESIFDDTLHSVAKYVNQPADFSRQFKVFEEEGISVMALMIFGFDTEAEDAFKKTHDFLNRQRIDYTLWHPLVPFPKTRIYDKMKEAGRLKSLRWWLEKDLVSSFLNPKIRFLHYSDEEFRRQFLRYYRSFYSPVNIFKRLVLPPKKRLLGKLIMNITLASRISAVNSVLEN